MKAFWNRLSRRERILLAAGAALISAAGVYLLLYRPLLAEQSQLQVAIEEQQRLRDYLAEAEKKIRELEQTAPADRTRPLNAVVEAAGAQAGIGSGVEILSPQDRRDRLEVRLAHVEFDRLIGWLALLDTDHAVAVRRLELARDKDIGFVSGQLTVERR